MPGFPDRKRHSFPQVQVRIESRILRLSLLNLAILRVSLPISPSPNKGSVQPWPSHLAVRPITFRIESPHGPWTTFASAANSFMQPFYRRNDRTIARMTGICCAARKMQQVVLVFGIFRRASCWTLQSERHPTYHPCTRVPISHQHGFPCFHRSSRIS
jgi:hypothetical protein